MSILDFLNKRNGEGNAEMSFIDHLEVLRWHIIRSLIAIMIFTVLGLVFSSEIYKYIIMAPTQNDFISYRMLCKLADKFHIPQLCLQDFSIKFQNFKVSGQFMMYLNTAFYFGVIAAFPYLVFEIWRFIKPALKPNEHKYAVSMIFWVSISFILGVLFAFFILIPYTIQFFAQFKMDQSIENIFTIQDYFGVILDLILGCGIVFMLPLFMFFLTKIGVLTPAMIKKYNKHTIVILLIVAAVITPPDVFSQMIVFVPMFLLFQIGLLVSNRAYKKRHKDFNDKPIKLD